MKSKLIILLCMSLLLGKVTVAQKDIGVERCWFFSKQTFAGTIMVDENGKKLTKSNWFQHFIYVETNCKNNINWQRFAYKNKSYKLSANLIKDSVVLVGTNTYTHKPVIIKAQKAKQLWLLNIDSFETEITKNRFYFTLMAELNSKKKQIKLRSKSTFLEPDLHP